MNNRTFERHEIKVSDVIPFYVKNKHLNENEEKSPLRVKKAIVLDHSLSGMKIETMSVLFPNQVIELEFSKQGRFVTAEVVGMYEKKAHTFIYGIQFLTESDSNSYPYEVKDLYRELRSQ